MIAALIALIAILMLGGSSASGWTAGLDKPVKKQVHETARREAVLTALDVHASGLEEAGESLQEHFVDLLETHLDHASTRTDFDAVTARLRADQDKVFRLDLETRRVMKASLSQEEWVVLFQADGESQ